MTQPRFIPLFTSFLLCSILYIKCSHGINHDTIALGKTITKDDLPCVQMQYFIEKYADQYDIPIEYAYGLAYMETTYRGPLDSSYTHKRISPTGALGPTQILLSTARYVNKDKVSRERLLNDIEYNIQTSMKYLRMLHNRYKNWGKTLGYYNTGRPKVNKDAKRILNKEYQWVQ